MGAWGWINLVVVCSVGVGFDFGLFMICCLVLLLVLFAALVRLGCDCFVEFVGGVAYAGICCYGFDLRVACCWWVGCGCFAFVVVDTLGWCVG